MKNRAKVLLALFMGVCVFSISNMDAEAAVMDSEMSCAGISVVWSDYLEETGSSTEATVMPYETTVVGETAPQLSNETVDAATAETTTAEAETTSAEDTQQEETGEYANVAIAQVTNYVNLRSEANAESEVVGKLYNNSAATVLAEEGDWYKIKSGTVDGYVKAEFVVTGDEAAELAKTVGTRMATVDTETLKVRENPNLESTILTLVAGGDDYEVLEETEDGWAKIIVDTEMEGYVSADYVTLKTEFVEAESIEEEQARLAAEEQERLEAEAAARQADEEESNTSTTKNNDSSSTTKKKTTNKTDTSKSNKSSKIDTSN